MPSVAAGVLAAALLAATAIPANGQVPSGRGFYSPLDQNTPPGMAGRWAAQTGRSTPGYFQPLKVSLPSTGRVTVFSRAEIEPITGDAPAMVGVAVGYMYRLRIGDMPEFPGVELYPSVEILDRLHPPAGKAEQFPLPVEFTLEEIELALAGRMVTKVVYLEQPQLAPPEALRRAAAVRTIPPSRNLLVEADRDGRPMVLVRLGGRLPDLHGEDRAFFGTGAPLRPVQGPAAASP